VLENIKFDHADLSRSDFSGARASGAVFDRATLFGAVLFGGHFAGCSFEFADLRSIQAIETDFSAANFVGTDLRGARLHRCVLRDADFYWADLTDCELIDCDTAGARLPEPVRVVHGPKGVVPLRIVPRPLYRTAATEEEFARMLSFGETLDSAVQASRK
jgi:uncharacterized protein YjbI with pentapeptide repeats